MAFICSKNSATFAAVSKSAIMAQMYKVFINDRPLFLTSLTNFNFNDCIVENFTDNNQIKTVVQNYLTGNLSKNVVFFHKDIDVLFNVFCKNFKLIHAAGGRVKNTNDEILFILRHGRWDLPKGKVEPDEKLDECAIREVQEECGVKKLSITKKLIETYHVYELKKELVLKTSHWYEMICQDEKPELVPQLEESITEVKFLNKKGQEEAIKNTYPTIIQVLEA